MKQRISLAQRYPRFETRTAPPRRSKAATRNNPALVHASNGSNAKSGSSYPISPSRPPNIGSHRALQPRRREPSCKALIYLGLLEPLGFVEGEEPGIAGLPGPDDWK